MSSVQVTPDMQHLTLRFFVAHPRRTSPNTQPEVNREVRTSTRHYITISDPSPVLRISSTDRVDAGTSIPLKTPSCASSSQRLPCLHLSTQRARVLRRGTRAAQQPTAVARVTAPAARANPVHLGRAVVGRRRRAQFRRLPQRRRHPRCRRSRLYQHPHRLQRHPPHRLPMGPQTPGSWEAGQTVRQRASPAACPHWVPR
jgi:hypothetical protein